MHLTNKHWGLYFCTALFCHVAILSAVYDGSKQDRAATQYSQTITTYFSFVNSNPKTLSPNPSPASGRGEPEQISAHPIASGRGEPKQTSAHPIASRRGEPEQTSAHPIASGRGEPKQTSAHPIASGRGEPKQTSAHPISRAEQRILSSPLARLRERGGGEGRSKLLAMLHIAIQEKQTYPLQAALSQESGTAIINFSLLPNGKIIDAMVIKSSGSQTLDQAALDAVQAISPFKTILTTAKKDLKVAVSFALSS